MKEKEARVLTEKEKARAARLEEIAAQYQEKGYVRRDVTITIAFANVMAIVLSIPFIILFVAWFFLRNGFHFDPSFSDYLIAVAAMVVLIVVHELIHGLVWGLFAPHRFKTIEFGFMKEMMTPYCTCGEPLKKGAYMLGAFMPCLVLGLIPCVASVYLNSGVMLFVGLVMVMGAGGDLTIILKMLRDKAQKKEVIIMDHPTECGYIVFEKEA